ncbi:MAG: Hsp70 family protein [Myxococcales bacterium]|nr:Hsp70 family protein [Myxococcales bacterium]
MDGTGAAAPKFALGIDLGTTNCALAATPLSEKHADPQSFAVPQVIHPNEVKAEPLLPSSLYLPARDELPRGALALPWAPMTRVAVGRFARDRGAGTPVRLIHSAKSWLSHAGVDRRGNILPWGAPDEVPRISPLDASARYLEHLRAAWDDAHPEAPLDEQEVVLTVPASFDAVARELTVEAAVQAGLPANLRLLEEPQAALYAWLADRGADWRKEVAVGDTLLVIDIGGGTTDFSLIAVREGEGGTLELERVAVGEHILLGGDNIDLALAYTVKARLEADGHTLDDWQMRALTHGCRVAKEQLLSDLDKPEWPLVVPGRGSRLIGGTLRTALQRAELDGVMMAGFLPVVAADARPAKRARMGLQTLGLPYATDAAITRHLAAFLGRDGLARRAPEHSFLHPSAVLFNGGVTRSPAVRQRILEVLGAWVQAEGGLAPTVLEGVNPDQAVSRGAAYYAHARAQGGVRIKGGTTRAYYVGVERAGLAVPGLPPQIDALCIAPFGMEEGSEVELPEPFGLYVGEPVHFRFFGSGARQTDTVGAVVSPAQLDEVAPIETTLTVPEDEVGQVVPVHLHARVTEVGTLELSAVQDGTGRRWKLSFNVRVE